MKKYYSDEAPGAAPRRYWEQGPSITDANTPMANLLRRLKKLEAVMLDDVGLVTGSPRVEWEYWNEQAHASTSQEILIARNTKVPLEVLRRWMQTADPDLLEGDGEDE